MLSFEVMEYVHKARHHDTIGAVATPPGLGGIAIIRVSGREAIAMVNKLLTAPIDGQPSHTVCLRTLYDSTGCQLDQALLLVMRPPRSFTGEETVEIQCHGGYVVARRILETLFHEGVRPAEGGEFSLRAFLNGKIDLAQAEAVQALIGAKSDEAMRVAGDQLSGKFSEKIRSFQQKATELAALFEAGVDFPEDDLGDTTFEAAEGEVRTLASKMADLVATYHSGQMICNGVSLCILGAPNVGKSSLMNRLLGKDRAIVSPTAGTTRDLVEDDLMLNGIHCRVIDTAGIRETSETIEGEGVRRSRQAMERADIALILLDASRPDDPETLPPLQEPSKKKSILVWNKIDCVAARPLPSSPQFKRVFVNDRRRIGVLHPFRHGLRLFFIAACRAGPVRAPDILERDHTDIGPG